MLPSSNVVYPADDKLNAERRAPTAPSPDRPVYTRWTLANMCKQVLRGGKCQRPTIPVLGAHGGAAGTAPITAIDHLPKSCLSATTWQPHTAN